MPDIEARREARRRRILENSEKRLLRITGVQKRNASYELEGYKSAQNIEDEVQIENHVHNGSELSSSSSNITYHTPQLETIYRNPLFSSSFLNGSTASSPQPEVFFTKVYRIRIIVGTAFIFNLLHFFFQDQNFLLNNIFIPLLCFEAIDLYYNQNNETNNEIINILRLFSINIPPEYLLLVIKYFTLFITITRDLMIYFFAFVCVWFILKVLQGIPFF